MGTFYPRDPPSPVGEFGWSALALRWCLGWPTVYCRKYSQSRTLLRGSCLGQPMRPHHARPTRVAFASGAPANPLQTQLFDVQIAVWASSSVSGGWCSACRWQRTTSAAICQWQNLRRSTDSQQFRRLKLLCSWTQSMECSSSRTPTWHQLWTL